MQSNAPESAKRPTFSDDPRATPPPSPAEAFSSASSRLAEIKDYASYYLAAKLDGYKSSAKSAVLYAVLGLLGAVAGTAILATAAVLFVRGIAEGLAILFNGRGWLADLLTGFLLLALILGGTYFVVAKLIGKSLTATKAKYDAKNREQFAKHGHNVHERAKESQHAG
jgi:hypothetical protein